MTTRYLSLVLVEVPDQEDDTKYRNWFQCVSVDSLSIKKGLLEIVFADGSVKVFNEEETDDIFYELPEYLHGYLQSVDESSIN